MSLALAACLAPTGCARLRSFRQGDHPAFGTETALADPVVGVPGATGDLYAERLSASKAPAASSLARRDPAPAAEPAAAPAPAPADGSPKIALQTPETLRPLPESNAAPATEPAPAVASNASAPAGRTLEAILAEARQRLDSLTSYQVKMNRQERVGGALSPAEDVVLSIRRQPQAVRLEWPEGQHKGREVLYAADAKGGLMHVRMGGALLAVPKLSMPPDSPLALRNSRHPITEAGFDTILQRMEQGLQAQTAGAPNADRIRFEGRETPEGYPKACDKVVRVTASGETWTVYLDPDTRLPTLVQALAADGDVLERYLFRDPTFNPAELASADAFDPDARWGSARGGLFQRLARSGGTDAAPDATRTR